MAAPNGSTQHHHIRMSIIHGKFGTNEANMTDNFRNEYKISRLTMKNAREDTKTGQAGEKKNKRR